MLMIGVYLSLVWDSGTFDGRAASMLLAIIAFAHGFIAIPMACIMSVLVVLFTLTLRLSRFFCPEGLVRRIIFTRDNKNTDLSAQLYCKFWLSADAYLRWLYRW